MEGWKDAESTKYTGERPCTARNLEGGGWIDYVSKRGVDSNGCRFRIYDTFDGSDKLHAQYKRLSLIDKLVRIVTRS